ncbi:MAG: hypothetical protein NTY20_05560, partial [Candidatus Aenigmarchaeota archaeon]|nr:hypothetical protein [Candidatus Aenigmarchaeota archaeon]
KIYLHLFCMDRFSSGMILFIPLVFLLMLPLVSAHQPRLVMDLNIHDENSSLLVPEPEVSKAYYGELAGKPDYYKIVLENTTQIYVGITVPDIPERRTDLSAELYTYQDTARTQVILLDGSKSEWKPFYEEFGGDWYLQGPETRENLSAGTYFIKVSSPSNRGKYSLAIGEEEAFPPDEIVNTYLVLPVIKQQFFGKPIGFSLFHFLGIVLAMGPFFAASVIIFTSSRQRIKSAVNFYGKLRYLVWFGILLAAATTFFLSIQNPFNLLGMLRLGIFAILILLFLHANSRVRKIEDKAPAILKLSMLLSILFWILFLFFTVVLI